jgi:hypothetical protein
MKPIKKSTAVPASEFSDRYVDLMYKAMCMSYFKYGKVADAYPEKVDAIASLEKRLQKYKETGNTEWLVDVGNFAMIEFMRPRHPKAHFAGTDQDTTGRQLVKGVQSTKHNLDII